MSGGQMIVMIELVLFFGAILGFCWWQMRLMRAEIDDENGSALAKAPSKPQKSGADGPNA